jgi:microcystin-dependent protein
MSSPFVGEIRMFAGTFAPRSWALCDGQLLAVSQNDALFALLGTIYGGDGRTTFGLPDMRGRVPLHNGQGPGLTNRNIGSRGGGETATVSVNQLPAHAHTVQGSSDFGADTSPTNNVAGTGAGTNLYNTAPSATVAMNAAVVAGDGGGGQPHANVMPFECVNFIICLFGIFPSRF